MGYQERLNLTEEKPVFAALKYVTGAGQTIQVGVAYNPFSLCGMNSAVSVNEYAEETVYDVQTRLPMQP